MKKPIFYILIVSLFCASCDRNPGYEEIKEDVVIENIEEEDFEEAVDEFEEYDDQDEEVGEYDYEEDYKTPQYESYLESKEPEGTNLNEQKWREKSSTYKFNEEEEEEIKEYDAPKFKKKKKPSFKFFGETASKIILYALVFIIVGFLIYFLIKQFYNKGMIQDKNIRLTDYNLKELNEDDLKRLDTEAMIAKAEKEGDFKKAFRLRYLRVLQLLVIKQLIRYKKEYTNHNYVSQIRNTDFENEFASLTLYFDSFWYGDINISDIQYQKLIPVFKTIDNKIIKGTEK